MYTHLEASGPWACCFSEICLECCCPCCEWGDFFFDYSLQNDLTSSFAVLPTKTSIIDALTYRELKSSYSAKAEAKPDDGTWFVTS